MKKIEKLLIQADRLAFVLWAERTHPRYLNNLKDGWRRYKEAKK